METMSTQLAKECKHDIHDSNNNRLTSAQMSDQKSCKQGLSEMSSSSPSSLMRNDSSRNIPFEARTEDTYAKHASNKTQGSGSKVLLRKTWSLSSFGSRNKGISSQSMETSTANGTWNVQRTAPVGEALRRRPSAGILRVRTNEESLKKHSSSTSLFVENGEGTTNNSNKANASWPSEEKQAFVDRSYVQKTTTRQEHVHKSLETSFLAGEHPSANANKQMTTEGTSAPNLFGTRSESNPVLFDKVTIVEYGLMLGDNPSVRSGPPITMVTAHNKEQHVALDDYENLRLPQKRSKNDLYIDPFDRELILRRAGYSFSAIERATEEAKKTQRKRAQTNKLVHRSESIRSLAKSFGLKFSV